MSAVLVYCKWTLNQDDDDDDDDLVASLVTFFSDLSPIHTADADATQLPS